LGSRLQAALALAECRQTERRAMAWLRVHGPAYGYHLNHKSTLTPHAGAIWEEGGDARGGCRW